MDIFHNYTVPNTILFTELNTSDSVKLFLDFEFPACNNSEGLKLGPSHSLKTITVFTKNGASVTLQP